jgi:hypothetical protein
MFPKEEDGFDPPWAKICDRKEIMKSPDHRG